MNDIGRKLIDSKIVECTIYTERLFGRATSITEIVRKYEFHSENDFWDAKMSEAMSCSSFVQLLRDCLLPPAYETTPSHVHSITCKS